MKLEDQLCSLELAKKLKELGVKQESLFYRFDHGDHQYIFCKEYEQYSPHVNLNIEDGYSAFTASELGKMLPDSLESNTASYCEKHLIYQKSKGIHGIGYWKGDHQQAYPSFNDETEANCRAKMLIWLIEHGYVKND